MNFTTTTTKKTQNSIHNVHGLISIGSGSAMTKRLKNSLHASIVLLQRIRNMKRTNNKQRTQRKRKKEKKKVKIAQNLRLNFFYSIRIINVCIYVLFFFLHYYPLVMVTIHEPWIQLNR